MGRRTDDETCDASGYAIFDQGALGAAHVMAHRLLDAGRPHDGHRWLGARLERLRGDGSDWVHLQWHMMVFEIAVGRWARARQRFDEAILPAAVHGDTALTDAPAGLWRLALAAPFPADLPWRPLCERAQNSLDHPSPFVQLHHLLAFAGAGDLHAIDAWVARSEQPLPSRHFAGGLRAQLLGDDHRAVELMTLAIATGLGGSRAQGDLFAQIRNAAARRLQAGPPSERAA